MQHVKYTLITKQINIKHKQTIKANQNKQTQTKLTNELPSQNTQKSNKQLKPA